jgi:hypothetical protein
MTKADRIDFLRAQLRQALASQRYIDAVHRCRELKAQLDEANREPAKAADDQLGKSASLLQQASATKQ